MAVYKPLLADENEKEICPTAFLIRGFSKVWSLKSCIISRTFGGAIPSAANTRDCFFITYPTVPANDDPAMILPIIAKIP